MDISLLEAASLAVDQGSATKGAAYWLRLAHPRNKNSAGFHDSGVGLKTGSRRAP